MDDSGFPLTQQRIIIHYEEGHAGQQSGWNDPDEADNEGSPFTEMEDVVATEYALTIYVNNHEMATVVCTPEHLEELAVGFLASEGLIHSVDEINRVEVSRFRGTVRVETTVPVKINQDFYNKRYITSCCGKGRQSFYFFNDAHTAKRAEDKVSVSPEQVFALMDAMEAQAKLWEHTGGVHTAGLCTPEALVLARSDIGRHNALDKLYGHALREGVSMDGRLITFSGRLSSEVLLKCAKIGVGLVLAKSAPTQLALDIAEELNITAVGFVRGRGFHVYTHPWRIVGAENA